ncbi:[protein-PII] uridylyltransferase [Frankia sp. B2]|uniref:[protein-PII] uridylyltransferase n=1 Tax=unclassified Frankia TaxID=2632575 RepID=UPI0004DD1AB4|nr:MULTISPECIES: [protein-PII] uridylyltransferase [unclassified Frankia]KEZ38014.1 UTP:GlnB (protein PII) uridylyltransferase [Frankia sp. CeD]TFE35520.1 [protein-PII] uridylyltransferase [Frankia sp. B2]
MTDRLEILKGRSEHLPTATGPRLRRILTDLADDALVDLFGDPGPGIALVAVGGYGRAEPAFGSDLDLVLVHDGKRNDISAVADAVWYPLWDSGVGLDHSVRTVDEAIMVADGDLKAALGLLDARHVAGDATLATQLAQRARARWRSHAPKRLPELAEAVAERATRLGEVAFLLEPDLKESRGGLRDVHALHALAAAWVAESPPARVIAAGQVLLDARGEIRRLSRGRAHDRLLLQDSESLATMLGYADAFALAHAVADAGRAISWTWDTTWYRVAAGLRSVARWRGGGRRPARRPLGEGVVDQDGEVQLARDVDPAKDPVLVLRAAAAAARSGLPLGRYAVDRLAREAPPMPDPWPDAARDALVALLATGDAAVGVLESLDQVGLLVRLIPEWAAVRSRPQRNPYHRYTVDRHLMEAAARAAAHTREVDRPDLLLLGALLHDIGKGFPGDHTDAGIVQIERIGPRLGLPPEDVDVLVAMVRHHLLLGEAATRRDIDDPGTIASVAASAGSVRILTLLHRLTEADSRATGPTAWNAWKARLIGDLVERARAVLGGERVPCPPSLDDRQRGLLALPDEHVVQVNPLPDEGMFEIVVVNADHVGLLAIIAGVLALNRLDIRRASARRNGGRALLQAAVAAPHERVPEPARLLADLRAALAGTLDVAGRLAARERDYARARRWTTPGAPQVIFDDDLGSMTVIEVRAPDQAGVLYRIVRALSGLRLDVATAIVATLGLDVVDAFYVREADGGPVADGGRRREIADAILAALGPMEPIDRAEPAGRTTQT